MLKRERVVHISLLRSTLKQSYYFRISSDAFYSYLLPTPYPHPTSYPKQCVIKTVLQGMPQSTMVCFFLFLSREEQMPLTTFLDPNVSMGMQDILTIRMNINLGCKLCLQITQASVGVSHEYIPRTNFQSDFGFLNGKENARHRHQKEADLNHVLHV